MRVCYPKAPRQRLFGYDLISSYRENTMLPKNELHSSVRVLRWAQGFGAWHAATTNGTNCRVVMMFVKWRYARIKDSPSLGSGIRALNSWELAGDGVQNVLNTHEA